MNVLDKVVTDPLLAQERGVRDDSFIGKISNMESRLKQFGRTALTLNFEKGQIQYALMPSESDETMANIENAISQGKAYIITHDPSDAPVFTEHAIPVLLVNESRHCGIPWL